MTRRIIRPHPLKGIIMTRGQRIVVSVTVTIILHLTIGGRGIVILMVVWGLPVAVIIGRSPSNVPVILVVRITPTM